MAWDSTWEDVFRNNTWGKYPPERVVRFVAINFYARPVRSEVRLLDLGCAAGAWAWYMAREGFAVSAIDGSPTAVRQAAERLQSEGMTAETVVADFTQLPWEDGHFDGVVDNAAIYTNTFAECRRTVREVHRILKPGGLFLSCNFTPRTWGFGLGDEVEPGGFVNIRQGPLAGKGFSLFMNRSQIEDLYNVFSEVIVDTESMTLNGGERTIELWVVKCRKG